MSKEHIELSRRKALLGIGAVGVASAGAGLGTSAYFWDESTLPDNEIVAGELQLFVNWEERYDMGDGLELIDIFPDVKGAKSKQHRGKEQNFGEYEVCELNAKVDDPLTSKYRSVRNYSGPWKGGDDKGQPLVHLQDVKPGDYWETTLSYHLCDNDGWVWLRTHNKRYEDADANNKPSGHLADWAWARVWYDMADGEYQVPIFDDEGNIDGYETKTAEPGDNHYLEGVEPLIAQGSLRDVLDELNDGILLDSDPLITPINENNENDGECVLIDDRLDDKPQQALRDAFDSNGPLVFDDGDNSVELTITGLHYQDGPDATDTDIVGFDWESDVGVCRVDVKGGPPTKINAYDCDFSGTALSEFGAGPGGSKRYGISWIEVHVCPEVVEPPEKECTPASTTHYIGFEWGLPGIPGQSEINEIQGDRLSFDLQFKTEQCRHNPFEDLVNPWTEESVNNSG